MAIVLNGSTGISAPDIDSSGKVVTQDEVRAEVVAYGSNQNEPYMVAASTSYTGATTNWGTYGFQHRLKSDGSGVVRITADSKDGEAYSLSEVGNATFAGTVTATSYTEEVFAITGSTPALDPSNGSIQTWQLTSGALNPTDSFSSGESMTMMITFSFLAALVWPAAIEWAGGSAPQLGSPLTTIVLWKVGSTLYGSNIGVMS